MYNENTRKSVVVRQIPREKIREDNEIENAYEQTGLNKRQLKDWYTKVDENFNQDINGF